MTTYADTSFLVSLYVQDSFSARAQAWLAAHPTELPLTEFGRTELRNAITRLVFTKAITQAQADAAWQTVEADLKKAIWQKPPGSRGTFRRDAGSSDPLPISVRTLRQRQKLPIGDLVKVRRGRNTPRLST